MANGAVWKVHTLVDGKGPWGLAIEAPRPAQGQADLPLPPWLSSSRGTLFLSPLPARCGVMELATRAFKRKKLSSSDSGGRVR